MVERDEGFGDGVFAPALGVALGGLFEEAVEGADEVGNQLVEAEFGGQFGGFGDDQVDAVGKSFLERGDGLGERGVAQYIEAFDLGFDLAVRHKIYAISFCVPLFSGRWHQIGGLRRHSS